MRPLSLAERGLATPTVSLRTLLDGGKAPVEGYTACGLEDYTREIVASGFPGLRNLQGRARRAQLDGYLLRIVDRDFAELGRRVRNPAALRRWMTAYAAASSTSASFETIRDASTSGHGEKPVGRRRHHHRHGRLPPPGRDRDRSRRAARPLSRRPGRARANLSVIASWASPAGALGGVEGVDAVDEGGELRDGEVELGVDAAVDESLLEQSVAAD